MGLNRIGLGEDASRIADKYVSTVKNVFEKTGRILEKYDGLTNGRSRGHERMRNDAYDGLDSRRLPLFRRKRKVKAGFRY